MNAHTRLFNVLTVLVLALTVIICLCAGVTFVNPGFPLNPLKPHGNSLPATVTVAASSSPTAPRVLAPSLLPTGTATKASTATLTPTVLLGTPTAATNSPTATRTPFPTPVGPTVTKTPTEPPTGTATRQPPPATATIAGYPQPPTQGATSTPGGYP